MIIFQNQALEYILVNIYIFSTRYKFSYMNIIRDKTKGNQLQRANLLITNKKELIIAIAIILLFCFVEIF